MATCSETRASTSRENEFEPDRSIQNFPEKLNFFWSQYSLFALEKSLRTAKRSYFFTSKKTILVTTLSETHALVFREYVGDETKSNPEQFKPDELLWSYSSLFA